MRDRKTIVRFSTVGVVNTATDISLFLFLRTTGLAIISSNILSTSVALTASFFLNHNYTFRLKSDKTPQQFAKFIVITLVGLWVLQPIAIVAILQLVPFELVAKAAATAVSMAWNYLLYSKLIFKQPRTGALEG